MVATIVFILVVSLGRGGEGRGGREGGKNKEHGYRGTQKSMMFSVVFISNCKK